MYESRNKYVERYEGLFRCFLFDYQQKCMDEYTEPRDKDKLFFLNQNENGVKELKNSLIEACSDSSMSMANELIKQELREVINFQ